MAVSNHTTGGVPADTGSGFVALGDDDQHANENETTTSTQQPQEPTSANDTKPKCNRIDTQALNGLRGLVALHIMVFHSLFYSKWQLNILGSVQMPLFFLISGFILALNDGKRKYHPKQCCCCCNSNNKNIDTSKMTIIDHRSDNSNNNNNNSNKNNQIIEFNSKDFYIRRAARTLPLYYLCNLIALPMMFLGYGSLTPDFAYEVIPLTIFVATTWFLFPMVLDGPSWFVSTMWFFYWLFPCLITKIQNNIVKLTSKWRWIKICYLLQWFNGLFFEFLFDYTIGYGFYVATFWPVSRLPVFLMGIFAGLLRLDDYYETFLKTERGWKVINWNKMADTLFIVLIIVFIVCSIIENVTNGVTSFNYWLQLLLPWWQLEFIYVLTKIDINNNENYCLTYKFLTSKIMLYFGRISYSLYLIHEPMIQWIEFLNYGKQSEPSCDYDNDGNDCQTQWDTYDDNRLMPLWCIPILWICAIIAAIALNRFFEEPMRKFLRPKK